MQCHRCGARFKEQPSCGKTIHLALPEAPNLPDGAAGMLVEAYLNEPPMELENLNLLRDQARKHYEAGNLMHFGIYEEAVKWIERNASPDPVVQ